MDHGTSQQGLRHRLAQVFHWLLGGRLARDQYRQSASAQRDGEQHGLHDVDTSHDLARQAREAFGREHHERMRRYGR